MQHPPELKTKFLELRSRGVSYGQIAETIGVSKPTLIQWGKSMAEEIADLQAAERELVREKLLGNFEQWLGRQVHHFNRLDEEFGGREFKYSLTESVFRMMMASRKVLDRYFFDDDKPSRRGRAAASDLEGRVPSSPATATAAIPLPGAAGTQSLGRSTGSELGPGEGQTGNPAFLPRAVETQSPGENDDAKVGNGEGHFCFVGNEAEGAHECASRKAERTGQGASQTGSLALPQAAGEESLRENKNSKPPADSARMEMQNQTFSGPFLDQKDGGSSASAETQNPTFYPPFIHQKEGGSMALRADSAGSQSEIRNPKSEIESALATSLPCVESSAISTRAEALSPDIASLEGPSAETQNPAKTQPFTSQNSGPHKPNLSTVDGEGRAMCPHSAESQSEIPNLKAKIESAFAPLRPCIESSAMNPSPKTATLPYPLNDPDLRNKRFRRNRQFQHSWLMESASQPEQR